MRFLSFLFSMKKNSANIAKGRLQLILSNEHSRKILKNYFPQLQQELIALIVKYIKTNPNNIQVNYEGGNFPEIIQIKFEDSKNHISN